VRDLTRVRRQFCFSYVSLTKPAANQQINKIGGQDLPAKYQRFLPSWVKA